MSRARVGSETVLSNEHGSMRRLDGPTGRSGGAVGSGVKNQSQEGGDGSSAGT